MWKWLMVDGEWLTGGSADIAAGIVAFRSAKRRPDSEDNSTQPFETVETLLELLSADVTFDDVLADYPDLEREDLLAVLAFRPTRPDPRPPTDGSMKLV
jgi:hypothetical protein